MGMESDPTKIYRGWFGHKEDQSGLNRKSQYIFVISPWHEERIKENENDLPGTIGPDRKGCQRVLFLP